MTNSNPFEAYVSPHLMPSVGLDSRGDGGQRQQLWDSDATNSQASNFFSPHPSLFTSVSASNTTFYADIPFASTAARRGGDGGGYQLYPTMGAEYTAAQGLVKSEDCVYGQSIGLNLGHRTYFPMVRQNTPRCQAEGCMADLSAAKHYHRRHKVCEYHSKATVVVAVGLQQRFCQQCSRFHVLSEFDENKRSCRKRLADHNRRRRKPRTLPLASTTAGNRSVHPSSDSTEKKEASTKSTTKGTAAAKDAVANTSTRFSTISTTNRTNMSASSPKECQKKASPLRHGPALSLGGIEGADKGGFGFNPPPYGLQRPWAVASDDNTGSLQPEHQQRHIACPSPSSTFFPHNFLHCGSNDASLVADGGCDQAHDQNNLMHHMHHGQAGVFEAEYFI